MPPSQLKRLKASLREQGIVGPQQSKKQKKRKIQNGISSEKKISRGVALTEIREQFNPFEFRELSKKPKFEATTLHQSQQRRSRPGLAKSREEKLGREAYIEEQRRRKKVGGIIDKRFGENDPSLGPEEKMLERFTREKQLQHKKSSAFDLEDDDTLGELTHMGKSLSLDGPNIQDDFSDDVELSDVDDDKFQQGHLVLKRARSDDEDEEDSARDNIERPERKKSKQEVMKELIAKSKFHKYERQAAKDDDQDLREELDKETASIHRLLQEIPSKTPTIQDLPNGINKAKFDKNYDIRMRQMALDKKSQPTEKSKTEEEIVAERARKLEELESIRLRRMRGSPVESDDENPRNVENAEDEEGDEFGFGAGIKVRPTNQELGVEDEDEFLIEEDLVASGSEIENSENDDSLSEDNQAYVDDSDDEFLTGNRTEEMKLPDFLTGANAPLVEDFLDDNGVSKEDIAYQFTCPQSHEEFLETIREVNVQDLPIVVQRIRTLYHPKLKSENKTKLANFSNVLIDHIFYLANQDPRPPFTILEALIRHTHSLAKSFPIEISTTFRRYLQVLNSTRAMSPTPGDLVLLTAIGVIFPTSDHFHQVVTLAILSMSRYLGLNVPQRLHEYVTGSYLCTLCLSYQRLSERYVPELINFIQNTLYTLAPFQMDDVPEVFHHKPKFSLRLRKGVKSAKPLCFYDCVSQDLSDEEQQSIIVSLMEVNFNLLRAAANLWAKKPAFIEVFQPALKILQHIGREGSSQYLPGSTQMILSEVTGSLLSLLAQAKLSRRPLELHHHRPLAIKTSLPKFEESFNPDRHYDPDKTRTEMAKLKKEHKREKKGVIRELRKEGRHLAVQSLRDKREKDAAYEKKYQRLIAEIQGEEGREAKVYEREKELRKKNKT
ncbi:putative nucleolar complex protein 14 [Podosphaera aphanis]|nr:putative nucleolar complex protein 14 [Podosphaera aphanis]